MPKRLVSSGAAGVVRDAGAVAGHRVVAGHVNQAVGRIRRSALPVDGERGHCCCEFPVGLVDLAGAMLGCDGRVVSGSDGHLDR